MANETVAYIAIGSNINPERNIERALVLLNERHPITALSTFYRSAALDRPGDPDFVNGMCSVTTTLEPRALKFSVLREIENQMGRHREDDRFAPRTIDLDIALFGDCVIDEDDIQIPDSDIANRPFLAIPLQELAPETVLPNTNERISNIMKQMKQSNVRPMTDFTNQLRERLLK